jgi:hypothetical protein
LKGLDLEKVSDGFLAFSWENLSPKDRVKILADAPRTVWIFGAGASHHYNLNSRGVPMPLSNDFFRAFHELPTSEGFHAHVGPLISFLAHYRGVKPHEASKWRENIEEFMTSVENELNNIVTRIKKGELDKIDMLKAFFTAAVFNNMTFIFANVINEAQNGPSNSAYHYLLDFCGPNDTFITFNWDTLLDRALAATGGWTPNEGYGISFSSALDTNWKKEVEALPNFNTNWKLLKLHGSTNWLVPLTHIHLKTFEYVSSVPKSDKIFLFWQSTFPYETHKNRWRGGYVPTCYCYYPPNIPAEAFPGDHLSAEPGRVFVKYTLVGIFSPFKELSGGGILSSPLLITPVRQKRYDMYQSTIENIWQKSLEVMRTADKIVIIGYSFPPTDTRILELLENALYSSQEGISVEIIAPDAKDIISRIGTEHLKKAKNIVTHSLKFEEYLQILSKDAPLLMKTAAAKYPEVRDWLERIYALGQASSEIFR